MGDTYFNATASAKGAWKKTSSPGAGAPAVGTIIKGAVASPLVVGGRIRKIRVTNHGAAIMFFQVFDATALPTSTVTVATDREQVGIGLSKDIDYGPEGLYCALGIVIAASSTSGLFTAIGTADADFMIEWMG
jgi:hypothetical protein